MANTWTTPLVREERTDEQNAATEAIAIGCAMIGMNGIVNEKGAREFLTRALICAMAGIPNFDTITATDVKENIGIRVDVKPIPRPRFHALINRWLTLRAFTALRDAEKHVNTPIVRFADYVRVNTL
jgi:hypothetical protein